MQKIHKYTDEEIEFLRNNVKGTSYEDLRVMFNNHFNLDLSLCQISGTLKRHELKNGLDGNLFKKGNIPHNAGKKLEDYLSKETIEKIKKTQFKKGVALRKRQIGETRITKDGYVEVKVDDCKKWELRSRLVYEQYYGEIQDGYAVLHLDLDTQNDDIENLILVSRADLARLNQLHLLGTDADINKTSVVLANLITMIHKKSKKV